MDNLNVLNPVSLGNAVNLDTSQPRGIVEQYQQASFLSMSTGVCGLEELQMPCSLSACQQISVQRPLSDLNVSQHFIDQYLPLQEDFFPAFVSRRTTTVEGGRRHYESDLLSDIDEIVRRELMAVYVPAQTTSDVPELTANIVASDTNETMDLSIDEYCQRTSLGNEMTSRKRSRPHNSAVNSPPKKRARNETATILTSRPGIIPSAVPSTIAMHVHQLISDSSLSIPEPDSINQWIIPTLISQAPYKFQCGFPGCGKLFKNLTRFKTHFFVHTHISDYRCSYVECGGDKCFRDQATLDRHIRSKHTKEKPYTCHFCLRRFARLDYLKKHIGRIHPENI